MGSVQSEYESMMVTRLFGSLVAANIPNTIAADDVDLLSRV